MNLDAASFGDFLQAYQLSDDSKQISHDITITFPGDENGVEFTQSEYLGTLDLISKDIDLSNGPIHASDLDVYLDEPVTYELEADMFEINPDTGIVKATNNFKPELLSSTGVLILYLKVIHTYITP